MLPGMLSYIRTICNTNFRLGGLAKRRFIAVIACVESSFLLLNVLGAVYGWFPSAFLRRVKFFNLQNKR